MEGCVDGSINSKDLVVVTPGGAVEGELRADSLEVAGMVSGRIHCRSLTILPQGRVSGTVLCDHLSIASGGEFRGQRQAPGLALPLLRDRDQGEETAVAVS